MVNEVNKLIFNALISGREVYIAELGTLYITRHESAKLRKNRVEAPSFTLMFTPECRGEALSSIICKAANVTDDEAADIARRWLQKSTNDGRVVIEGIGTIANGTITIDTELSKRLKGSGRVVELTKQKSGNTIAWAIVVALLLCSACICTYIYIYISRKATDSAIEKVAPIEIVDNNISDNTSDYKQDTTIAEPIPTPVSEPISSPAVQTLPEPQNEPQTEVKEEVASSTSSADWREQSVRHYVIFGSYSTLNNANLAIRKISRKNPDAQCKILPLGKMYAVAVYGSTNRKECERFKRAHRSEYKNAWIHTPKRFK